MEINNFRSLRNICIFKPRTFYYFFAIIKNKDLSINNHSYLYLNSKDVLLKHWLIESESQLLKSIVEMKNFVKNFNCRLYLDSNRKSKINLLQLTRDNSCVYLDNYLNGMSSNVDININPIELMLSNCSLSKECNDASDSNKNIIKIKDENKKDIRSIKEIADNEFISCLKSVNSFQIIVNNNWAIKNKDLLSHLYTDKIKIKNKPIILLAK